METDQAKFEGWAVVDVMGHQRHIGYVTTEAYGQAVLFRVDTPELPEREFVLRSPEYASAAGNESGMLRSWCPAGTKVKRGASPAYSHLIGAGSIYQITPCTEEAARLAIEKNSQRPLILVEMPVAAAALIASGDDEPEDDDDQEDVFAEAS